MAGYVRKHKMSFRKFVVVATGYYLFITVNVYYLCSYKATLMSYEDQNGNMYSKISTMKW